MTNLDRILITFWILLISMGLVMLSESRPTEVRHERNEWHIHKAYIEVYDNGWVMSADTEYQTKREK